VASAAGSADLLVGPAGFDDAGAVRREGGRVDLFTVDFFPPVLDDPQAYGAVAAANALSDIYAMGGEARVVLNLAGLPEEWGDDWITPIFAGAIAKIREAEALWVGGHTVTAEDPLFGFAVFGEVSEEQLVTNTAAQEGDLLYLTKPLGCGSLATGLKKRKVGGEHARAVAQGMAKLNRQGAACMRKAGIRAATDVTGFGLFGHAANLARGSEKTLAFRAVGLPLYPGAAELAAGGVFSGGAARGREALSGLVDVAGSVPPWLETLCYDSETSGGLLIAVPEEKQAAFLDAWAEEAPPALVGEVGAGPARVRLL